MVFSSPLAPLSKYGVQELCPGWILGPWITCQVQPDPLPPTVNPGWARRGPGTGSGRCHRLLHCLVTYRVTGCERRTEKKLHSTFQGTPGLGGAAHKWPASLGVKRAEGLEPTDSQPQQPLGLLLVKVPCPEQIWFHAVPVTLPNHLVIQQIKS